MPARALGLTWAKVAPGDRQLDVTLDLPDEMRPRGPMTIPVSIGNLQAGRRGLRHRRRGRRRHPQPHQLQAAGAGRLVFRPAQARHGNPRHLRPAHRPHAGRRPARCAPAATAAAARLAAPPPTQKLLAFYSGIVAVDADGKATVTFDLPDFNGTRPRHGDGVVEGRRRPRVEGRVRPRSGGGHRQRSRASSPSAIPRACWSRSTTSPVRPATISLSIATGDGIAIADADADRTRDARREAARGVQRADRRRPASAISTSPSTLTAPSGEELADRADARRPPGRARRSRGATSSPSPPAARSPSTARSPPSSCRAPPRWRCRSAAPGRSTSPASSPRSTATPMAASSSSPAAPCRWSISTTSPPRSASPPTRRCAKRVQKAIGGVLADQAASGAFGLWGPEDAGGDLWLDAYVTDFLTRAAEKGYDVPDAGAHARPRQPVERHRLRQRLRPTAARTSPTRSTCWRAPAGPPSATCATTPTPSSTTSPRRWPRRRSARRWRSTATASGPTRAFAAAMADLDRERMPARLAQRLRHGAPRRRRGADARRRNAGRRASTSARWRRASPTTERGQALHQHAGECLDADGRRRAHQGCGARPSFSHRRRDASPRRSSAASPATRIADSPVVIENLGDQPLDAVVAATGVPTMPDPAGGNGFKIERTVYTPDGELADVADRRPERPLRGRADRHRRARPRRPHADRRSDPGRLRDREPGHLGERRHQRLRLAGDRRRPRTPRRAPTASSPPSTARTATRWSSRVAYTVRAVSPGTFIASGGDGRRHVPAGVHARTDTGTVEVVGPTR